MTSLSAITAHAIGLRRDIHRHPELSFQENRTAGVVRGELNRLGIPWRACAQTGTVAVLGRGKPGKRIALRADLDALPITERTGLPYASAHEGCMHACGHDGHTASLLAATAYLTSREADLPGPVTLLFQPAEEQGGGADHMVRAGALDEVDEVYGYHNWPPLPFGSAGCQAGPLMAANAMFDVVITGRGGHASAPHQCVDPLVAAANAVLLAQQVVSRQIAPIAAGVISFTGINGGTTYNVIPDTVRLMGTIRAMQTELRDELAARLEATIRAAVAAAGCTATFDYRPMYPATVNDPRCAAIAAAAVERVLGTSAVTTSGLPLMASEDFSYYLQARPGCYILLGAGRPGAVIEPCHSPRFDYNDELIPIVVRLWADLAGVPCPVSGAAVTSPG
ncbi:MAG: amidohydrolase [Planctomycetes bacterium]|nr:amidohydrolase [Planctomycetota bacterium]